MEAVKIHGTKWTKIAKMWTPPGDRTAVRTVAWPKSTPIKELGLARIARPHHTLSGRDPRACAPKEKGASRQPPPPRGARRLLPEPQLLSLSLCMWPIGRPLQTREERSVAAPPIYRGAHSQRCRRLLPPFFPPSRLSKLFQEPLEQRDARAGAARGKGCS